MGGPSRRPAVPAEPAVVCNGCLSLSLSYSCLCLCVYVCMWRVSVKQVKEKVAGPMLFQSQPRERRTTQIEAVKPFSWKNELLATMSTRFCMVIRLGMPQVLPGELQHPGSVPGCRAALCAYRYIPVVRYRLWFDLSLWCPARPAAVLFGAARPSRTNKSLGLVGRPARLAHGYSTQTHPPLRGRQTVALHGTMGPACSDEQQQQHTQIDMVWGGTRPPPPTLKLSCVAKKQS